jgi:hypothetical protein
MSIPPARIARRRFVAQLLYMGAIARGVVYNAQPALGARLNAVSGS